MILVIAACLVAASVIFNLGYFLGAILAANRDDR